MKRFYITNFHQWQMFLLNWRINKLCSSQFQQFYKILIKRVRAWLPDRGVQLMAGRLAIIQLCKQRKEDLHTSDGVYAALD